MNKEDKQTLANFFTVMLQGSLIIFIYSFAIFALYDILGFDSEYPNEAALMMCLCFWGALTGVVFYKAFKELFAEDSKKTLIDMINESHV